MPPLIVTRKKVFKILSNLKVNKSPGFDNISARVLKELAAEISDTVTSLFQKSIDTASLPSDWKLSVIAAIYKKGLKCLAQNYRPVALTSILCKCLETIVRDHILEHLKANDLISRCQYGFLPGRSTSLQLLKIMDDWTASLENGHEVDVIYTDFMKAFDKVPSAL